MSKRSDGFKVEESQRQSWLSIAAVWAGGMICVPSLMVGGVLVGGGLSMAEIVLSILIGYGLICAYMIFIGMQACDTGLPVAVMASGALGEKGGTLHHQRAARNCLHRLVRHSVRNVRQCVCPHDLQHAGHEGVACVHFRKLHHLGSDYAGYGLLRLQGSQVAQLHCRSAVGHRLPVRFDCRHRDE